MLTLLPALAFGFVFLCLRLRQGRDSWRESILASAVILGVCVVLITEGLSLFHAVTTTGIVICWSAVCVVAAFCLRKELKRSLFALANHLGKPTGFVLLLLGGIAVYLLGTAIVALFSPPNTWDTLEYHMPKVMHWIQNGSVAFYPTPIPRQNHLAPGAEFMVLHLQLLSGSDRFTNMVEWMAMLGSLAGVSLIARELGAKALGQCLAAVFAATLPMGIMQASSAQTDYVVAFWFVCFLWFFLRLLKDDAFSWPVFLGLSCSLGLAALTKATVYLFAPFFLLWLAWWLLKRLGWRVFSAYALITAVFLLINLGHFSRNWDLYGHPLGPRREPDANTEYSLGTYAPAALASSVSKHIGTHINTPWPQLNASILKGYVTLHQALGFDLNDRRTTFGPNWVKFSAGLTDFHDETAGNPVHFVVALLCMVLVLSLPALRRDPLLLSYTLAVAAGFLLLACFLKWHPWMGRLHHGLFVAAAPFVAVVVSRHSRAWLGAGLGCLLLLLGLPWLLLCQQRPVLAWENIFNTPREKMYFKNPHQRYEEAFTEGREFLRTRKVSQLGLATGNSSWEYLWWWYAQKDHPSVRIEHVNVSDVSKRFAEQARFKEFRPDAILSLDQKPQSVEKITVGGDTYTRSWMKGKVGIYLKE